MNNKLLGMIDRSEYKNGKNIKRWERYNVDAGKDGNSYQHQLLTSALIKRYAKEDSLGAKDLLTLRITSLVHDLGEYIEGDITGDDKTIKSQEREKFAWIKVATKVSKRNTMVLTYMKEGIDVDVNENNPLYIDFKFYEKLGYLYGAILASQRNESTNIGIHWLCHNVLANQFEFITSQIRKKMSARKFLNDFQIQIGFLFELGEKHKDRDDIKNKNFQKAKELFMNIQESGILTEKIFETEQ